MRRHRNVKIVATLGPASSSEAMIQALFQAGADVFRLNMSHGSHDDHRATHAAIRRVEEQTGRPIAILADLQGPKLRVGSFANGPFELADGQRFRLDLDPAPGDASRVQLPHPEIFTALAPGAELLINDGKIRLRVDACGPDFADCTVQAGGEISDRKGVNVPDVVLPVAALSDKDRKDLEFACELGVDWLALSFVQRPEDVHEARQLARGRAAILSKIEKPAAVRVFDEILAVSDGVMVARGDLGVELPVHAVPPIQKRLVRACRAAAKPVIVATQMLDSMISSPRPTRAEVSDVANAILDGADAVMLSGETSIGEYPIETVATMSRIVEFAEREGHDEIHTIDWDPHTTGGVLAKAALEVAERVDARFLVAFTKSGDTARRMSRLRPSMPLLVFSPDLSTRQVMTLSWGINALLTPSFDDQEDMVRTVNDYLVQRGITEVGDRIVILSGSPMGVPGKTNNMRVHRIRPVAGVIN